MTIAKRFAKVSAAIERLAAKRDKRSVQRVVELLAERDSIRARYGSPDCKCRVCGGPR